MRRVPDRHSGTFERRANSVAHLGLIGSARNEVHGRPRTTNELYLMDAVIEPERLVQISLGQENPRIRMNAAPGSLRTRTLKGFHNTVLCSPFRAKRIAAEKPGALPQADLLRPVGPNRSVSVGFQEFVGLCGLPHFPMTSASPSHPRFLTRALHFRAEPKLTLLHAWRAGECVVQLSVVISKLRY